MGLGNNISPGVHYVPKMLYIPSRFETTTGLDAVLCNIHHKTPEHLKPLRLDRECYMMPFSTVTAFFCSTFRPLSKLRRSRVRTDTSRGRVGGWEDGGWGMGEGSLLCDHAGAGGLARIQ